MSEPSDIIDLTKSFTLSNFPGTSTIVIDDTDDSFCIEANCSVDSERILTRSANAKQTVCWPAVILDTPSPTRKKTKINRKSLKRKSVSPSPKPDNCGNKKQFGACPICWDELGKNPLASTKCGHVYCMKCLQEYLRREKKCPTCRQKLKGSTAYHPLYLSKD